MQLAKILIVEDEEDARTMLGRFLRRSLECEVSEAADGRKALEEIEREAFDLILLDIKMPGLSGLDVLARAKEAHPGTEITIISGYDSQQAAKEAFQKGAADYIVKPSSREFILKKVIEVLKKKDKYSPKESAS